jgi:DNA-binding NarL/FixJ family response regulator/two-component sensor histidine kinase
MRAVLEERVRLSRELHDGFAQLVAFLLVRIDTVTDLVAAGRKPEALSELDRMRSSTDDLYQDVREAITELRTELAQRGLPATLREYAEEYEERHGITVSLHGEDATGALSSVAAYQLLRIVQEGLANVRKHAGAHHAWLEFDARTDRQLHVVIGDDGLGFDPSASERSTRKFGLTSMRERAEGLGGQLNIDSQRGRGRAFSLNCRWKAQLMEPAESRSRLLLVDDHALFREGLAGLFAYQDDFAVEGEAEDGHSALEQVAKLRPDMVLMDIDLPDADGIAVTRQLKTAFPDVIVVILTVHDATDKLIDAIKAGAQGYVVKSIRSAELLEQLRGLRRGEAAVTRRMAARIFSKSSAERLGCRPRAIRPSRT